jgi:hypothetical protein
MKHSIALAVTLLIAGMAIDQVSSPASGQDGPGWTTLLDGKSLDGWNRLGESNWRLRMAPWSPTRRPARSSAI